VTFVQSARGFVQSTRLWSALAFLVPFALYAFSISPNVGYWDTAEMQTVPWVLGIAHPTGFPVFVFAGWLFSHVVIVGSVAYRLGLMSAVAMAIAAWCAFAVVEELGEPAYLGAGAALLFGAGNVAWSRGARAEVHAFAVLFAALAIWQAVRFYRTGSRRALLLAALAFGFALGNHGIATLLFPGLVLLVLPRLRDVSFKTVGLAAIYAAAPLLLYLWIPLRSAQLYAARVDPTLDLGLPPGRPFFDFDHPNTLAAFLHYMGGGDKSQVGNGFLSMLDWTNYPDVFNRFGDAVIHEIGPVAAFFAVLGFALLIRRDLWLGLAFLIACGVCVPYGLLYPEADPARYLLTAFWGAAILAVYGASHGMIGYFKDDIKLSRATAAVLVFGAAAVSIGANRALFEMRNDPGAVHMIGQIVANTPDDAIVVANWTFATSLGYAAYVDRSFGHRVPIVAFPAEYSYLYPDWLKMHRRIYMVNQPDWFDQRFGQSTVASDPKIVEIRAAK